MRQKIFKRTAGSLLIAGALVLGAGVGLLAEAEAAGGVAADTPFYDFPMGPGPATVTKNDDGSYAINQSSGGGGTRLFYGDYTSGGAENPYLLDLSEATVTLSVDRLAAGQSVELAFMSFIQNGDAYPLQGYGQGFEIKLTDDYGGNTGFLPSLTTFSKDGSYQSVATPGSNWLVYNNISPRDSYLSKDMILRISANEGLLNISIDWAEDGRNTSAVNWTASVPLASLPVSGDYAFDYTRAYFCITNNDGGAGAAVTIDDVSDPAGAAYFAPYGGKLCNSARYTEEYRRAVKGFSLSAPTAAMVGEYYYAKMNFEAINADGMRKSDRYEYETAKALSTEGFGEAALSVKNEVFEKYKDGAEITDERDAIGAVAFYTEYSSVLSEYEGTVKRIRELLSSEDFGQKSVETQIASLLEKYAEAARGKYQEALDAYNGVLAEYDKLSAFAKGMVSNYEAMQAWRDGTLTEMKGLYYSASDSYFSNEYGLTEDGVLRSYTGAVRGEDGSTKLLLSADATNRLIYGTDVKDGAWTDYAVDLSDFSMTFTVDSSAANARFAVNFVTARSALAYGDETNAGLSVFFRMGFGGTGTVNVALTETAGGLYPAQNPETPALSGFINDWGGFGMLQSSGGVFGKKFTLSFKLQEDGILLSVSLEGGNAASILLTDEYIAALFGGEEIVSRLALTFSVGEGMDASYSEGRDIELTVKEIGDEYARTVAELYKELAVYKETVTALASKDSLTFGEIRSVNAVSEKLSSAAALLRRYEAADYAGAFGEISGEELKKIDEMAAAFIEGSVKALQTVSVDNFEERRESLASVKEQWENLTEAQKALYGGYAADVGAVEGDIAGCEGARAVIDAIAALIVKTPLPASIDGLRAEYQSLKAEYDSLNEKYRLMVSNYADFSAFGETLSEYDPAGAVKSAIEKLFVDYPSIGGGNKAAAKSAVEAIKDAYAELTEGQKATVDNYGRLAEFEEGIAAFEQSQIDYAKAAAFDRKVKEAADEYAEITEENKTAAEQAIAGLEEEYKALTEAQKAFSENYPMIAAIRAKIDGFVSDREAQAAAEAVTALINGIGNVENTAACKNKIDEARAAYDALTELAKAKVDNLETLERAEKAYAAFGNGSASESSGSEGSVVTTGGCGSLFGGMGAVALIATLGAFVLKKKKEK